MEEKFSDWESISFVYRDAIGDVSSVVTDYGGMKVTNDDRFLYIYIELNYEVNPHISEREPLLVPI